MTKIKIEKVLIANRGEIAVRIIRSLRDLGIASVAVYSDADSESKHRFLADFAINLKGQTSAETYLDQQKILKAMKDSGADSLHPGYGFLSENADFAEAVTKAGYRYIGPSANAMRLLGNKVEAKKLMRAHRIPTTPGSEDGLSDVKELRALINEIGYPLILKAAAGGGGRGMRVIRKEQDIETAFVSCQREATAYFGNPQIFAERFIENPRHIEVQVICDSHGGGFHLNERDCSVQRRHQKLIEEAPSCFLNEKQRTSLGEVAVKAALAAKYEGVGTVEFICNSPDEIYFMEVNTRIQVEHTVTEEITRIDLVSSQITIAQGEKLDLSQKDLMPQGWAIECRINAEDALNSFLPAAGRISKLDLPSGPHVRIDSHIYEGYQVPDFYDSMLAKIIVWGPDRKGAIARMKRVLSELVIKGVLTTTRFHEAVLDHHSFRSGEFDTGFVEKFKDELNDLMSCEKEDTSVMAAILAAIKVQDDYLKGNQPPPKNELPSQWLLGARSTATGYKRFIN